MDTTTPRAAFRLSALTLALCLLLAACPAQQQSPAPDLSGPAQPGQDAPQPPDPADPLHWTATVGDPPVALDQAFSLRAFATTLPRDETAVYKVDGGYAVKREAQGSMLVFVFRTDAEARTQHLDTLYLNDDKADDAEMRQVFEEVYARWKTRTLGGG